MVRPNGREILETGSLYDDPMDHRWSGNKNMLKNLLKSLSFALLLTSLLTGCRPSTARTDPNPGHRHAEEVGEMKLPNGQ